MNVEEKKAFLQFDFETNNKSEPFIFENPKEIIIAWKIHEVAACLVKIEQAISAGFYAAGYLSYEATPAFFPDVSVHAKQKMPLLWFGIFEAPIKQNDMAEGQPYSISNWKMNLTKEQYVQKFNEINEKINSNELEQINYTVQFNSAFSGDAFTYYKALRNAQQSNFSAYMDIGDYKVLSASPELFFKVDNRAITLKPMKGTIHRGKSSEEDIANQQWLESSDKNKYENRLTTELMCEEIKDMVDTSTIKITDPFAVERFPTVFQMTSTIQAKLANHISITDIFSTLFPCTSIAGTPKTAALQAISDLEKDSREVYCGAIGYITPDKEAIFNVPIRTVIVDSLSGTAAYGAGGAITKHSTVDEEYREVLTKSEILHVKPTEFDLLETFGLYDGDFLVYTNHLERLRHSANYFNFTFQQTAIENSLQKYATDFAHGRWMVRLLVSKDGNFKTEIKPLHAPKTNKVALAKTPVDQNDKFLYHKTTNREVYHTHQDNSQDVFDVLLWNEKEQITEFTIGNIVVELDGKLVTPPVSTGLLPGTFRATLLAEGMIEEQIISLEDLNVCRKIWLINSVRKWVEVEFQKG